MKQFIKNFTATIVAAVTLSVSCAFAGDMQAFRGTNIISGVNTNFSGWPTNNSGTNTGGAVDIQGAEHLTFIVQGYLTNGTAGILGVTLTTACTLGSSAGALQPVVNGTNQNDWNTNGFSFNIAIPALTNWWNYQTNIICDIAAGLPNGDFVGVLQVTNNFATNQYLSNSAGVFFINRKPISIPLFGR